MSNTLTNLQPDLYEDLDTISRELVGFIPAVMLDASAERAALNQTIRSFIAPASTAADITPAQLAPNTGDQSIANTVITISRAKGVPVRWNGEEQKGMDTGPGYRNILNNQFKQAMRTLVNLVEVDMGSLYAQASRAYGTASTDPFATDLSDSAQMRKILEDNGAPMSDLQLVVNTACSAKIRNLPNLYKANEGGSDELLRQGVLTDIHGFNIRGSRGVAPAAAVGTGTSYVSNNVAGYVVGATTIAIDVGSGTVLAGDVVTFAGDANKYVVATGVSAPGNIVLAAPGLQQTLADDVAMTIAATSSYNMAFDRNAIVLVTRAPAIPAEGDSAIDSMVIQDPRSGLAFEIRMYKEYRQVHYEVAMAWGYAMIKPAHCGILLGA